MTDGTSTTGVIIGSLAFLAGAFTTVATVFAFSNGKQERALPGNDHFDEWEESLGV